jgi:hypothetical protein
MVCSLRIAAILRTTNGSCGELSRRAVCRQSYAPSIFEVEGRASGRRSKSSVWAFVQADRTLSRCRGSSPNPRILLCLFSDLCEIRFSVCFVSIIWGRTHKKHFLDAF